MTYGKHYTPLEVANIVKDRALVLWRQMSSNNKPLVCDPSSGGGVFLEPDDVATDLDPNAPSVLDGRAKQLDFLLDDFPYEPDIFVGNPPFLYGGKIPKPYQTELYNRYKRGRRIDLCALFVWRTWELMKSPGLMAYICTNSICQGPNIQVLQDIIKQGGQILRVDKDIPWDKKSAAVTTTHLYIAK